MLCLLINLKQKKKKKNKVEDEVEADHGEGQSHGSGGVALGVERAGEDLIEGIGPDGGGVAEDDACGAPERCIVEALVGLDAVEDADEVVAHEERARCLGDDFRASRCASCA